MNEIVTVTEEEIQINRRHSERVHR